MGSIFWQLNDCWPVASWSSIDYYGRWKALQYYARRFYAPILVSPHVEDGSLKVYIVSDQTSPQVGKLWVRLMDFDGKILLEEKQIVKLDPLSSKVYLEWPLKKLTDAGATDTSHVFVSASLWGVDAEISRNLTYIAPTKEIRLKPAALTVKVQSGSSSLLRPQLIGEKPGKSGGDFSILITSPVLARSVYLSFGDLDVKLSDNYFDLLPGETAEITASSAASLDAVKAQLTVVSLTDAFASEVKPAVIAAAK